MIKSEGHDINQLLKIIGMKWVKTELTVNVHFKCSMQIYNINIFYFFYSIQCFFYMKSKQFKQYYNDVIMDSAPSHWAMK